jgi:hypothetical protein
LEADTLVAPETRVALIRDISSQSQSQSQSPTSLPRTNLKSQQNIKTRWVPSQQIDVQTSRQFRWSNFWPDSESAKDLVQACKENGFFYLVFRGPPTSRSLKQVDELISVGNAVFSLPLEEKEAYSTEKYLPSRLLGYASNKMTGLSTIVLTPNTVTSAPDVQSDHLRRRRMVMKVFR